MKVLASKAAAHFDSLALRAACLLAAIAVLAGCAGSSACPALPLGGYYCLQTTTAMSPFNVTEDLELRRGQQVDRLIIRLEVDDDGLRMAGISPLGQLVAQAKFDNVSVSASSMVGARFDPGIILALVQLALWPEDSARNGLPPGWRLRDHDHMRTIERDDEIVLQITREGIPPRYAKLEIRLPAADLTLTATALQN